MLCFLDKSEKDRWLPALFDLLYENMRQITPSALSYQQQLSQWLAAVSPALEKEPRQIILCFQEDALAGYVQYYTRDKLLMIEEVQLRRDLHRSTLFLALCRFLLDAVGCELQTVEAYADRRNTASVSLMQKMGMWVCEDDPDPCFVHMRGNADELRRLFRR